MSARAVAAVHAALAAGFVLLALASVAKTLPPTWQWLGEQRAASEALTEVDRIEAPGYNSFLPVEAYNWFRANLRADDRYYLLAPAGRSFRGVDLPTASRTFARYYLLPALLVEDPRKATIVLSLGPRPEALGLRYVRVERYPRSRWSLARVFA